jgi:hypothetical protein
MVLGMSAKTIAPNPIEARRRLRKTAMTLLTGATQSFCRRTRPEYRQCDRSFYGLINLANALTGRRATVRAPFQRGLAGLVVGNNG